MESLCLLLKGGWQRSARCYAALYVSHGRVSTAFPVRYAAGNAAGGKGANISRMCRDFAGFTKAHASYRPPSPRRHIAVTLAGPRLETVRTATYPCFHVPVGKRLPDWRPGRARRPESAYQ